MARYIRDYKVTFLVNAQKSKKIVYSTIDANNPLHLTFSVPYEEGKLTSDLTMSIYNMSPSSQKLLQSEDVKVMLEVGSRDTDNPLEVKTVPIFIGSIVDPVVTNSSSSDHVTRIKARAGYELNEIQVSASLESTTKRGAVKSVLDNVIPKTNGMLSYNIKALSPQANEDISNAGRQKLLREMDQPFKAGYSYSGTAGDCLNSLLTQFNLEASITQGGTVVIHQKSQSIQTNSFTVGINTGLLTIPNPVTNKTAQTQADPRNTKGYTFKTLLLPELKLNDRITVDHPNVETEENLIISKIVFSGGYEASHWYSTVTADIETSEDSKKGIADHNLGTSKEGTNYFKLLTED